MAEKTSKKVVKPEITLANKIRAKAQRKMRAKGPSKGVWFGLGMLGLVGWSVVVPTLLGAGLGMWLDTHYPDGRSWTLALLVGGLVIGCFNAWHWITKEEQAIRDEQNNDDEIT